MSNACLFPEFGWIIHCNQNLWMSNWNIVSLCSCSLYLYRFNGNFRVIVILVCWTVLIYFLFHFLPLLSSLRLLTLALTVFSNQRFCVLNRGKKSFKLSRRSNVESAIPQILTIFIFIFYSHRYRRWVRMRRSSVVFFVAFFKFLNFEWNSKKKLKPTTTRITY